MARHPFEYKTGHPLWVFAYGSLIWKPGFEFVKQQPAIVYGYHRSLCLYSYVHRGTPEKPGLVLALDRGGCTKGLGFMVAAEKAEQTIAYLREREMVNNAYCEVSVQMKLSDCGEKIKALTYVMNRNHPQYAKGLNESQCAELVRQGIGQSGANPEYLNNSIQALKNMGICDHKLERIAALV